MAPLGLGQVRNCTNCLCGNQANAGVSLYHECVPSIKDILDKNTTLFIRVNDKRRDGGGVCYWKEYDSYPPGQPVRESIPLRIINNEAFAVSGIAGLYTNIPIGNSGDIGFCSSYGISGSSGLQSGSGRRVITNKTKSPALSSLETIIDMDYFRAKSVVQNYEKCQCISSGIVEYSSLSNISIFPRNNSRRNKLLRGFSNDKLLLLEIVNGNASLDHPPWIFELTDIISVKDNSCENIWHGTEWMRSIDMDKVDYDDSFVETYANTENTEWVDAMISLAFSVNFSDYNSRINEWIKRWYIEDVNAGGFGNVSCLVSETNGNIYRIRL